METQETLALKAAGAADTVADRVLAQRCRARRRRGPAPEAIRHLAKPHLDGIRGDRARGRHGARLARLRAGRMRFRALQHEPRVALRRHGHPRRGRRLERHLPDRRARTGRVSLFGFEHRVSVRRGRRAARQGAGGAQRIAEAAQDHRVRHGWPARFFRPAGDQPRRVARGGPRVRRQASRPVGTAPRRAQGVRPCGADLYVRHDGQAERRDALARQSGLRDAALRRGVRAAAGRRAHVLPAALPCGRARGRRLHGVPHRHAAQLRGKPRDGAGERARDRAHGVRRRAAHLGEILFGGDDPCARGDRARAARLQARDRRRLQGRDAARGGEARAAASCRRVLACARAGAQQYPQGDRGASLTPAHHRRCADLAGPDPLVHGARARDGRGVGPDRVRRHRDLQPARRREARLDRQAAAGNRS